jgi:hypothetical protein
MAGRFEQQLRDRVSNVIKDPMAKGKSTEEQLHELQHAMLNLIDILQQLVNEMLPVPKREMSSRPPA